MEAARRKPAAAAMALTLVMVITLVASSAGGTVVVAAARLQGEGGGHGIPVVSESPIPTVAEGKYPGSSNCTHDYNKPKSGPCPPE
ncbi:hypothetical protein BDA96_02G221800 [Sorghum bicolor]|jgi:hypothetical protein|uniref:Uncharacterized protein n=2 Tax=Sorghum bicolor TaxID=4558 RepID=A0A921RQE9_SORBI|nr:hypothetical protein BDA96_02G221800 [Sorghum bicolor]OQU89549.1 hypothetical protein SORBI_3002G210901 [Sorghum bicolor]